LPGMRQGRRWSHLLSHRPSEPGGSAGCGFNQVPGSVSLLSPSQVIVCFGIAVLLHQYVGFALVALLVEINSIFLHLRQILLMANLMHTTCYRLNSIVNLGTYVVFRIATLAWMTRWLFLNRENVPPATYAVGTVGMAIMTPMNLILFYRLLRSDFFKSSRDVQREKEE
uniref:TLC domain-containing protein n=1 Tax=Bubo bubo TaxID=30461 RepID=A0A8C0ERG4_BUBBB